jgi:diacylglycerol kinase (ATP)
MTPTALREEQAARHGTLDIARLNHAAPLIFNPQAGQRLGISTNRSGTDGAQSALAAEGIQFDPRPTERAGHGTELARHAAAQGRKLVIVAGGDGTVSEVARGLAGTDVVLGIMPLGSIMNVARTLCIPRNLRDAAGVIAAGSVLAMDMGKVADRYFLEAAGAGLDAGLFTYLSRLEKGGSLSGVVRGASRFLRSLGMPRLALDGDGQHFEIRAPMVAAANCPFVGAACAIAPGARVDDGLFDVAAFPEASTFRVLLHLALVSGGRQLPIPPKVFSMRVRSLEVSGRRPLPVHADGTPVGRSPVRFEVVPAALKVLVGTPDRDTPCAWDPVASTS